MAGKNWPYLITGLLQAGWTEQGLEVALGVPRGRVREYRNGRKVGERTALELSKIVSMHNRREGSPFKVDRGGAEPRNVAVPPLTEATAVAPERGVYRNEVSGDGYTSWSIVMANGKAGFIYLPNELVDPLLTENLWQRLDKKDPVTTLKAI